jgi:uncharacterized membrane protein
MALGLCACQLAALAGGEVCSAGADCEDVMRSVWGRPLGVPLPILGVAFFLALLALSLVPTARAAIALRYGAAAGGLAGLGLIVVQVVALGRVCPLCLVVDLLAIALAVVAWKKDIPLLGRVERWAWVGMAVLALAVGAGAGAAGPLGQSWRSPPAEVLALRHPSKVTVVELVDLDCRHCRHVHWMLNHLERETGGRMHRISLSVPPSSAPLRLRLARHCARKQGREAFQARPVHPSEGIEFDLVGAARSLGLSVPEFETCINDPATLDELEAHEAWVVESSKAGLPAVWIQDTLFRGGTTLERLRAAFLDAERRLSQAGPP